MIRKESSEAADAFVAEVATHRHPRFKEVSGVRTPRTLCGEAGSPIMLCLKVSHQLFFERIQQRNKEKVSSHREGLDFEARKYLSTQEHVSRAPQSLVPSVCRSTELTRQTDEH